jgi:hypothetical protein
MSDKIDEYAVGVIDGVRASCGACELVFDLGDFGV